MCPITHSSDPHVVSCTFGSTSLFGSSLLKDLNFLTAPPHEKMNETAYVDLPERHRQLNQQILCYEKLSQLHQARAPVPPSGPDLLNGEAPQKIERKGVELLAKLGAPGAPGSGAALSAQQLALASLSAQLKVCEETLSQEVATLEAKAKPAKESKAPAAPAPVSCPMGPVAPMAPVAPRSERELLKQMLRRNEVFKIRFLMRRDGFHHYDLKNLRSEL